MRTFGSVVGVLAGDELLEEGEEDALLDAVGLGVEAVLSLAVELEDPAELVLVQEVFQGLRDHDRGTLEGK